MDSKPDSAAFEQFLAAQPSRVDLWLGGHTHTSPDDTYGGKSHVEQRWGTTFVNVAALTKFHTAPGTGFPRSWLLTFTAGSDEASLRCYLHGNEYAPIGWYAPFDRVIKLSKPFSFLVPAQSSARAVVRRAPLSSVSRRDANGSP